MFKVINKDTNTAPLIVNFEYISHLAIVFLLSTLSSRTFKTVSNIYDKVFLQKYLLAFIR